MQNKILIIDDDIELCQLLKKCIEKENMTADFENTGTSGLKKIEINKYQLIVLDIMLPEISGFDVLTELRKTNAVPVLMLTAKDSEVDKVSGLRLGADDYLTKPFNINEFLARVQSLIRRYTTLNNFQKQLGDTLSFKGITIDNEHRFVLVNEKKIELTVKEFDLLYLLASNKGKVFTKKQIYSNVWKDEYAFDDGNIMSYISKIRRKIEADANNPIYIQTIWGVGYCFNEEVQ
jgi:DNA-binding response OmpR family regulator